jgi:probable HAF family extracellular repeat protein
VRDAGHITFFTFLRRRIVEMKARVLIVVVLIALMAGTQVQGASFQGLGALPGHDASIAKGISYDGTIVIGTSISPFWISEGFQWTLRDGMVGLGNGHFFFSSGAIGVSGDGSVAVGTGQAGARSKAVRWTSSDGIESLGSLIGGDSFFGSANGANFDGSVLVGGDDFVADVFQHAFRWEHDEGMTDLGTIGDDSDSCAYSVSADGKIVVGVSWDGTHREAFHWTEDEGMQGLGFLAGHDASEARDISMSGMVVVGTSMSDGEEEAFMWTEGGGMVGLGDLRGGAFQSKAYGVNENGAVVVGVGNIQTGDRAAIWLNGRIHDLKTYLFRTFGLRLDGWTLTAAYDVSADGKTIVGAGINPDGDAEAWVANIAEMPFPGLPPGRLRIDPSPRPLPPGGPRIAPSP